MNINNFKLAGRLVSKAITLGKNKDTKMNWMMAVLQIEVGKNKRVDLSIFANEKTSSGNDNKIFKSLQTIQSEYMSMNSTIKNKRNMVPGGKEPEPIKDEATTVSTIEECTFVRCNKGVTLQMNRYVREGEVNENFKLSANFVNRVDNPDEQESYIEGSLSGMIEKRGFVTENDVDYPTMDLLVPEFRNGYTRNDGEEIPARVVVERFPLILRMEDEDAISYFNSEFEENVIVELGIEPVNEVTIIEKKQEGARGFGKVPTFNETKITRELRIIGGYSLAQEEYENEEAFKDFNMFQAGIEELNKSIEELKSNQGKDTTVAPRGFGKQGKSGGDLPF